MPVMLGRERYILLNHFIPGPSRVEVEITVAKFEKYKSPGSDDILANPIQAGVEMLLSAIHNLINSILIKEELMISGTSQLLYKFTKRVKN
jgi:hypothetical protein